MNGHVCCDAKRRENLEKRRGIAGVWALDRLLAPVGYGVLGWMVWEDIYGDVNRFMVASACMAGVWMLLTVRAMDDSGEKLADCD